MLTPPSPFLSNLFALVVKEVSEHCVRVVGCGCSLAWEVTVPSVVHLELALSISKVSSYMGFPFQ